MLKYSSDELKYAVINEFNLALHTGVFHPDWHITVFQMLPKEGDLRKVSNWRPIAILPSMYKVFPRLVYNRISPTLFASQSEDQHAFTPGIRIEDALLCAEVAVSSAIEFNSPLWLLSIDLRKASDTIDHEYLFKALGYHGLDPSYITLLRKLYGKQQATVQGSQHFDVQRGVKQGDVLSAIIFNCVLDVASENWKRQLSDEGILIESGHDRLTSTRYADDILLCARSLKGFERMTELLV